MLGKALQKERLVTELEETLLEKSIIPALLVSTVELGKCEWLSSRNTVYAVDENRPTSLIQEGPAT